MVTYKDFQGKHAGETIWVLGSGKTLDFVDRTFFDGKTVVATNHTWKFRANHAYVCSNHWGTWPAKWLILPEVEDVPPQDAYRGPKPEGDHVVFVPTTPQKYSDFKPNRDWPEQGRMVVGPTSLHLSLHWAVWLGAAHIVLVGADCGVIDGENNLAGYSFATEAHLAAHAHHRLWERTLNEMAAKIRSLGVSVHSLNPWVTFNLEGHSWEQRR
jgi:hypothetical protein